ncbi:BTB/POZ protein [Ochromonadaceae sp. CCMP2298]|nr:BTB/POZ protein [Ochromonadaceae sp. CCMP2298]
MRGVFQAPFKIDDDEAAGECSPSGILKLNVGGAKFTTSISTVHNVKDSMLSAMFSGRHTQIPDAEGYHFIDRDGTHFRHILNLLRFPTEFEVDLPEGELRELEREAQYYGLSEILQSARLISLPEIAATSAGYHTSSVDPHNYRTYFTYGQEVLQVACRGWNVLLINPKTTKVVSQSTFDTYVDEYSVHRFVAFLSQVPTGTIVVLAVFDEFGKSTTNNPDFRSALHSCGGR